MNPALIRPRNIAIILIFAALLVLGACPDPGPPGGGGWNPMTSVQQ